jgi:dTDP-4-dehydrorhamnose 3,5-epimerase
LRPDFLPNFPACGEGNSQNNHLTPFESSNRDWTLLYGQIEASMIFHKTGLQGAFVIDLQPIEDERGFFARCFCRKEFAANGLNSNFVQGNVSFNLLRGTLRGMHYQCKPHEEAKLVRCIRGKIYDVIIDLRAESATFRRWLGIPLDQEKLTMLYVPEGFAHGYLTLTDNAEVLYQVSEFYAPEAERGLRWNDPAFGIRWPSAPEHLSSKDSTHPDFII